MAQILIVDENVAAEGVTFRVSLRLVEGGG
jgi:hypothetical protein